jgi:hypothetical protein
MSPPPTVFVLFARLCLPPRSFCRRDRSCRPCHRPLPSTLVTVARQPPLSPSPSPSLPSLAFIAASIAAAAVTLPLSVTRHPRRLRHRPRCRLRHRPRCRLRHRPRCRRCHRPRRRPLPSSPLPLPPSPLPSSSPATHVAVAIAVALALAALTLFFTLFAVARPPPSSPSPSPFLPSPSSSLPSSSAARSHCLSSPAVHRPTLTLLSLVDCCFFTPPADGGGGRLGASSAPPIQRTRPTPPRRHSKNAPRGCGVAATATAIPALATGQFWPTPSPGACTY